MMTHVAQLNPSALLQIYNTSLASILDQVYIKSRISSYYNQHFEICIEIKICLTLNLLQSQNIQYNLITFTNNWCDYVTSLLIFLWHAPEIVDFVITTDFATTEIAIIYWFL